MTAYEMRISYWSSDVCSSDLAIETVGGAKRGKAIIVLNPAEPPLMMRDTVYCLCDDADEAAIEASVEAMVRDVQAYVPGYRLKQKVQFERVGHNSRFYIPEMGEAYEIGRAHV